MYGDKFVSSHAELLNVPEDARDEFQVNDDGLVVWVGPDASWRDGRWGTTTTINGVSYRWGMPIVMTDTNRVPVLARIGDGNPDFHWGLSNSIQWKGLSVYGLIDAQVGGNVYNRTKQRMYQYFRSADVDQAGKPQERKKTVDYYFTLYNGNTVNNWFVEDGGFVKLRELSVKYRVPESFLTRIGAQRLARGISIGVIGRNLYTWTNYSGYDPEVGTTLTRIDDFIYPLYRTVTGSVEIEF
jgi:hypothetical protein